MKDKPQPIMGHAQFHPVPPVDYPELMRLRAVRRERRKSRRIGRARKVRV